jgi:hypothetical protein
MVHTTHSVFHVGGEIFLSSFLLSEQTWYAAARQCCPEHPVIQHHSTNSRELHIAELLMEYMQERLKKARRQSNGIMEEGPRCQSNGGRNFERTDGS